MGCKRMVEVIAAGSPRSGIVKPGPASVNEVAGFSSFSARMTVLTANARFGHQCPD